MLHDAIVAPAIGRRGDYGVMQHIGGGSPIGIAEDCGPSGDGCGDSVGLYLGCRHERAVTVGIAAYPDSHEFDVPADTRDPESIVGGSAGYTRAACAVALAGHTG